MRKYFFIFILADEKHFLSVYIKYENTAWANAQKIITVVFRKVFRWHVVMKVFWHRIHFKWDLWLRKGSIIHIFRKIFNLMHLFIFDFNNFRGMVFKQKKKSCFKILCVIKLNHFETNCRRVNIYMTFRQKIFPRILRVFRV